MVEWSKALWLRIFSRRPVEPYNKKWEENRDWYKSVSPTDGVEYGDLKDFADKKYAESCAVHDAMDKKAEWLFGIASAATGAIFVAIKSWGMSWVLCVPSFACAVVALALCLRTRDPGGRSTQMTIRNMVLVRERDPSWKLRMIASAHCAVIGLNCLIDWKGEQLTRASKWLVWGAVLFFILPLGFNRLDAVFHIAVFPHVAGYSESRPSDQAERKAAGPVDWKVRSLVRRESRAAVRRVVDSLP
jgi:hypothetical protein